MKFIPLIKNKYAKVDDDMYEELARYKWGISGKYPSRKVDLEGKNTYMSMHDHILGKKNGYEIDHINRDKLDNRKDNLRYATVSQNSINKAPSINNTSGIKGVTKKRGKWQAQINKDGKCVYLGTFKEKEDAASAYNVAAKAMFGDFAWLNQII